MAWRIEFDRRARRELDAIDPQNARRILSFLQGRLAPLADPRGLGEALKGQALSGFWKYRVGDFRIIADIDDTAIRILIVRIGNRREIYRR